MTQPPQPNALAAAIREYAAEPEKEAAPISAEQFFRDTPPGREAKVSVTGVSERGQLTNGPCAKPVFGDVSLHCEHPSCGGTRLFKQLDASMVIADPAQSFLRYRCRNCDKTTKVFALQLSWPRVLLGETLPHINAYKLGELPPFGPSTPARLVSMLGPDRDYFLKGRRAESQGMGIAAFAYYRRVIENQKNRILGEFVKVATKLNSPTSMIEDLLAATKQIQFSTSVEAIKHGIPEALLIGGHNPLTLLHSALSEGLHARTDEDCLELATTVRIVMSELAERLAQALKDDAELSAAVGRLLKHGGGKSQSDRGGPKRKDPEGS